MPIAPGTKKPIGRWKRFQTERPSWQVINRWFREKDISGLAVVTGAVSGGICCRDYDEPGAYKRWADDHADLARTLPTVRTSRGHHVWFRVAEEVYRSKSDLGDGELIGASTRYALLPPSQHPSGSVYSWANQLHDAPLPIIDPIDAGLAPPPLQASPDGLRPQDSPACVHYENLTLSKVSFTLLSDAMRRTLPTGIGQRNDRLWMFARMLKAVPGFERVKLTATEPVLREWWTRALPFIGTKSWGETWTDWVAIWRNVKRPWGGTLAGIAEWVQSIAPGGGEEKELLRLEMACEELARRHDGKPFHLSVRVAAMLVGGIGKSWAAKLLGRLAASGVLVMTQDTKRKPGEPARVWQYMGPQLLRIADGKCVVNESHEANEGRDTNE